ncbi:MAG TPA: hypothetical protein VKH61_06770 [Streptosporangiaceae bacterium]|nr:hypothetical protein [Streptosporangiaceae bacterium]
MNPVYWLLIVIAAAVVVSCLVARVAYVIGYENGHDEGTDFERGRHRIRPAAPEPEPRQLAPWEAELLPAGPPDPNAELHLCEVCGHRHFGAGPMHCRPEPTDEPAITTGEIEAITVKVEGWIADWNARGNYDRHTIHAKR